ncbi:unnamed protein product [Closterium sp. NIES-53]
MAAIDAAAEGLDDDGDADRRPVCDMVTGLDFLRSVLEKPLPPPAPPSQPSSSHAPVSIISEPLQEAAIEPVIDAPQTVAHEASVETPSRPAPPTKLRY